MLPSGAGRAKYSSPPPCGILDDQIFHGYLTTARLLATRAVLTEQLENDMPAPLADERRYPIDQCDAVIAIRGLDPGGCS